MPMWRNQLKSPLVLAVLQCVWVTPSSYTCVWPQSCSPPAGWLCSPYIPHQYSQCLYCLSVIQSDNSIIVDDCLPQQSPQQQGGQCLCLFRFPCMTRFFCLSSLWLSQMCCSSQSWRNTFVNLAAGLSSENGVSWPVVMCLHINRNDVNRNSNTQM